MRAEDKNNKVPHISHRTVDEECQPPTPGNRCTVPYVRQGVLAFTVCVRFSLALWAEVFSGIQQVTLRELQ